MPILGNELPQVERQEEPQHTPEPFLGTPEQKQPQEIDLSGTPPKTGLGVDDLLSSMYSTKENKNNYDQAPSAYSTKELADNQRYDKYERGIDLENVYGLSQPWYKQLGNGLAKMVATSVGTFTQSLNTIPDTIKAISDGKVSDLYQSDLESGVDNWLKNLENTFPNYYTRREQDHPFLSAITPYGAANFWGDKFIKNLGFTIGAIGGAAAQDALVGLATEGLGDIPLISSQIGKAALWLNKIFATGEGAEDIANTLKAAGTESRVLDFTKLKQIAAGKQVLNQVDFLTSLYGAARTEGGVEARDGYTTVKGDLTKYYQQQNGVDPTGKDLDDIEKTATASANVRFGLNMALLSVSDAIQFDNIIKPFSQARKSLTATVQRELEENLGNIELEGGLGGAYKYAAPKGLLGKVGNFLRPQIPNILAEGIYEEGGQYAAQVGTQNYYEAKYKKQIQGDLNDILNSTIYGLGQQFGSQEGIENMFLGALTGVFSGVSEDKLEKVVSKIQGVDYISPAQKRALVINQLNDHSLLGTLADNYSHATNAIDAQQGMESAVKSNNIFDYKNLQHKQFVDYVLSRVKGERGDMINEEWDLAKNLPDDQFKKTFGLDASDSNRKLASEYIEQVKEKAESIKENYEQVDKVFQNPYPYFKQADTPEKIVTNLKNKVFDEWKTNLTYLSTFQGDVDDRIKTITQDVNKFAPEVPISLLSTLTSRSKLEELSNSYKEQVKGLSELDNSIKTKEDREREKELNKHIQDIDKFTQSSEFNEKKYSSLFTNLLQSELNKGGVTKKIGKEKIPTLIQYGHDINRLNNRAEFAGKQFDFLSSDDGFEKFLQYTQGKNAETQEQVAYNQGKEKRVLPLGEERSLKEPYIRQGNQLIFNPSIKLLEKTPTDQLEAILPGGQQKTINREELANYNIADTKNQPDANYQNFLSQSIDKVLASPSFKTLLSSNPDLGSADFSTKLAAVNSLNSAPLITSIQSAVKKLADAYEKDLAKLKEAKSNLKKVLDHQVNIPSGAATFDNSKGQVTASSGEKKDLSILPISGTDPKWEDKGTADNDFHRRHQTFLFNLTSTDPKVFNQENKANLHIIPLTAATAPKLGFPSTWIEAKDNTGNTDTDAIRYVYVLDDPTFGIKLTNVNGNILVLKDGKVDPSQAIYTNAPDTSFQYAGSDNFTNKSNLDEKQVRDWWKNERKNLLSIKDVEQIPIFSFGESRGLPNTLPNQNNNVLSIGLLTKEDLSKPVITIPTLGDVALDPVKGLVGTSMSINMPLGYPLLNYNGNLSYLNNRNLNKGESENIYNILHYIANKVPETGVIDKEAEDYLRNVLYFTPPKVGIGVSRNQVYIDEAFNLHLGNELSFPLTPASIEIYKEAIIKHLQSVYFHVNSKTLLSFSQDPLKSKFNEIEVADGKLVVKHVWDNYQHFLLSPSTPDGNTRGQAPLTTNIVKLQEGEIPFIQKYPIIKYDNYDTSAYKKTEVQQPASVSPAKAATAASTKATETRAWINKDENSYIDYKEENGQIVPTALVVKGKESPITDTNRDKIVAVIEKGRPKVVVAPTDANEDSIIQEEIAKRTADITSKPESTEPTEPKPKGKLGSKDSSFTEGSYRATTTPTSLLGDREIESKEVERMLPQVKVETLDHLINMVGGDKAWGVTKGSYVAVFQGAPYGTKYHEAFHVVMQSFLSPKERLDLAVEFSNRKGTFRTFNGENKNYSQATFKEAEEKLAEEFVEYKTNGKIIDPSPKKLGFFRKLLNFIKEFIFGKPQTIANVFKGMDEGKYATSPISIQIAPQEQYRAVTKEAEAFVQDTLEGMTTEMFGGLWNTDNSLISQLEDSPEIAEEKLYSNLHSKLEKFFYDEPDGKSNTLFSYYNDLYNRATSDAQRSSIEQQFGDVREAWERVKSQWQNFVSDHKRYLRLFNVEISVDDIDERGQAEYGRDIMTVSAKNSASQIVKLLFATLPDSKFFQESVRKTMGSIPGASPKPVINREANQLRLANLAPYAKNFNYVLNKVGNQTGIYRIYNFLKNVSTDTNVQKNANVTNLLGRLNFDNGFANKNTFQTKLIMKFENVFSKQKPIFYIQRTTEAGETYLLESNIANKASELSKAWVANMKSSEYTTVNGDALRFSERILVKDNYDFLDKLGFGITKEEFSILSTKKTFIDELNKVKASIQEYTKKDIPAITTSKTLGLDTRIGRLAELYVHFIEGDDTESQHLNREGKPTSNNILHNYVSGVLADANEYNNIEDFISQNPQYNDIYLNDSVLLNNVLYKGGVKNRSMSVSVVEGSSSQDGDTATDNMSRAQRHLYEINNNLQGVFYFFPADGKTEWTINPGIYVSRDFFKQSSKDKITEGFYQQMRKYLDNEIALAKDYENRKFITLLNRPEDGKKGGRPVGKSLRFFKGILSPALVERIHTELIDNNKELTPEEEAAFSERFNKEVEKFLNKQSDKTINTLKKYRLIEPNEKGFDVYGLDSSFSNSVFNKSGKKISLSPDQMKALFQWREMNYIRNGIEMHKMFFSDPAQYKDETKRIKSFLSGREWSHVDLLNDNKGFNSWATDNLNKVGEQSLKPGDPGYHSFKNNLTAITVKDVISESSELPALKEKLGDQSKPYEEQNEADSQTWVHGNAYREMLWKAGGRFTTQQEELHQWMLAYERNAKSTKGEYEYSSPELREEDTKILSKDIPSSNKHIMYILKPIHSGMQYKNGVAIASLDKTSMAPIYYYFVEGKPLEKVYNIMSEKGIGYIRFESAHKVGLQEDTTTNLYNDDGSINEEGLRGVSSESIPFKYIGIQVDTANKKEAQTQGSQLTKLAVTDLMSEGVPVDWKGKKEEWDSLQEHEKLAKSPVYQKVQRNTQLLSELTNKRYSKVLDKLGVREDENGYSYTDKSKISDYLINEVGRRELPENIADAIRIGEDGEFVNPLEVNVQYPQIKNILWSNIEKGLLRPKVSGAPKVQLALTGWESKTAKLQRTKVNGKDVYTSADLRFYKTGENGNTEACEIMLPYHFGAKLKGIIEERNGIKFDNDNQYFKHLLSYLNNTKDGRELLTGIGFRIPTQGLSSVDHFVIKRFLAPQMGDVVVFPSEITTKAGSDFDVDKMNMYLKNWKMNKAGYPELVKFQNIDTNDEQQLQDFYEENYLDKYRKFKQLESEFAGNQLLSSILTPSEEDDEIDNLNKKYVPSLEEFILQNKGKSVFHINSLEAIENEYFKNLQDILSLPENFKNLTSPNNADQLKKVSNKINSLKGIERKNEGNNFTNLIDSNWMNNERANFLAGKKLVGVAAVSNTNLALNQISDVTGTIPSILAYKNIRIRLPHNGDGLHFTLSSTVNSKDQSLSRIGSQFIDGAVDIAKGAWLIDMGANESVMNIHLLMNKWGTDPETTALFIQQPAIQQFLLNKELRDTVSPINSSIQRYSQDWKLQQDTNKQFGYIDRSFKRFRKGKPSTYTNSEMEEMVRKYNNGEKLNEKENFLQVQMLDDFIGYNSLAWSLFSTIQGYNWDTTRFTGPESVYRKKLLYNKSLESPIDGSNKVLNNSFIGNIKNSLTKLNAALSSLFSTQTGKASSILDRISDDINRQRGLRGDNFTKYMQKAEQSMIDYITQTTASIEGRTLNQFNKGLLIGKNNVGKYIQALQNSPLSNNLILKNLLVEEDKREGRATLISLLEKDYDTYTSNTWTAAFRELRDSSQVVSVDNNPENNRTAADIYKNLVISQILQAGTKRSADSFLHLLPNEDYGNIVSPVLRNITANLDTFYEQGLFYKNMWNDNTFIPIIQPKMIIDDETGDTYKIYPYFANSLYNSILESRGLKNNVLQLDYYKYYKNPYLKIVDYKRAPNGTILERNIHLYKRVDGYDEYGKKAAAKVITYEWDEIAMQEDPFYKPEEIHNVGFKEVNKMGDGNKMQEYYDDRITSILSSNPAIQEMDDTFILQALQAAKFKLEYEVPPLSTDSDDDESTPPDEEPPTEPSPKGPLPITYTSNFRTWDLGKWEGQKEAPLTKEVDNLTENKPNDRAGATGESFNTFKDRILNSFKKLQQTAPDNTILITHSSVIKLLQAWQKNGGKDDNSIDLKDFMNSSTETGDIYSFPSQKGTIFVGRHGETEDNVKGNLRSSKTSLTDKGFQQIDKATQQLKSKGVEYSQIISSDLHRTQQTTEELKKQLLTTPKPSPEEARIQQQKLYNDFTSFKVSGKKESFQYEKGEGGKESANGYKVTVEGHPNLSLFVSNDLTGGSWTVTEGKTGQRIGDFYDTRKEAIAKATERLNNASISPENFEKLDKIGASKIAPVGLPEIEDINKDNCS